jgi:hypothetical protein
VACRKPYSPGWSAGPNPGCPRLSGGKRGIDSHSVLLRLAEVLWVDLEELTGSADRDETGRRAYPAAPLIEQAMMGYGAPGPLDGSEESGREVTWTTCVRRRALRIRPIRQPAMTRRAASCPS